MASAVSEHAVEVFVLRSSIALDIAFALRTLYLAPRTIPAMTRASQAGPRDGARPAASARVLERSTRQRRVIRDVFDRADRPLSIEEVLSASRRSHIAVSLSTVYRFVRALVDEGTLAVFELPEQGAFYELAGKAHHHHFSCVRCGRVYELNGCVSIEMLTLPKGFRAISHDLNVSGVCSACGTGKVPRAARAAK
jgi:Fur family ferric uptake transcriptional regulator